MSPFDFFFKKILESTCPRIKEQGLIDLEIKFGKVAPLQALMDPHVRPIMHGVKLGNSITKFNIHFFPIKFRRLYTLTQLKHVTSDD